MAIQDLRKRLGWAKNPTSGRMELTKTCKVCETNTFTVAANNASGLLPENVIRSKMHNAGWDTDRKGRCTCPECLAKTRATKGVMKEVMETAMLNKTKTTQVEVARRPQPIAGPRVTPAVPSPETAEAMPTPEVETMQVPQSGRQMSPIERRSIFRALDAAWDDAKNRYRPGQTDQTVALEINKGLADTAKVPVSWVTELRIEAFGGLSNEQAKTEALAALHLLNLQVEEGKSNLKEIIDAIAMAATEVEQERMRIDKLLEQVEAVREKIDAIG